ncbi:MAG: epimerase [Bacteroidetes bacterium]|nr:epimerase [Bacteroidota bacterium]
MRVILLGATGMVGSGVLLECLEDPTISRVLVLGRQSVERQHPKLEEVLHKDFLAIESLRAKVRGYDACFFCLGVSASGMKASTYEALTYTLTLHVAEVLLSENPGMTFCYVSGQGTDSAEKSFMRWARVKGKTENALLAMPFKAAYLFRPGYIHPVKGARTKTPLYKAFYAVLQPVYPLFNSFFPHQLTTTENIGLAMIQVVADKGPRPVLHSADINILAEKRKAASSRR